MDVFAHVLWTNAVFHTKFSHQRRLRFLAAFFGVLPDLISFVPVFIYIALTGFHFSPEKLLGNVNWTVRYAAESYQYTHSLVIFVLILAVTHLVGNLYFYFKKGPMFRFWFFWPMLGWLLHILIDIPTHKGFYETPFLFPLSNARFSHGIPWSEPVFMVINYGCLILVYIGLFIYQRKQRAKYAQAN